VTGIDARIDLGRDDDPLLYSLLFSEADLRPHLGEQLSSCGTGREFFERTGDQARIYRPSDESYVDTKIEHGASVFAAFRDPFDKTPITRVGQALGSIEIFREFNTGPASTARNGIVAGSQKGFLYDGGGNLALVLQELEFRGTLGRLNEYLTRFWQDAEAVRFRIEGGLVQIYVKEQGIQEPIPAVRLSDGTLKFLCLMAILLHPEPPPLICIEEPELGLHPDALAIVADALTEAAGRCQLIVTTHSEALVTAFSHQPESVVVCERGTEGGTQFRRLDSSGLEEWLAEYRLGELWRKGEIGGNRW
jgi:predicted ATPase